ncbi:MAG: type I restriction-modification system subunit M N-terminal domain-containing protein [Candidatus Eisenbacteria bacterium]
MNHSEIVSFLWGVADLIRDSFKRGKYQDVILPLTVLRRIDCVLAPTKRKVLETRARLKGTSTRPSTRTPASTSRRGTWST